MKLLNVIMTASFSSFVAVSAHAATVSILDNTADNFLSIYGTDSGYRGYENFEALGATFGEGEVSSRFATNVGTFSSLGGVGTGGTVTGLPGNTGTNLALREGNVFGRKNTYPERSSWFLDSNDTWGMSWDVALADGKSFRSLAFAITDASDVGGFLRISVGGNDVEFRTGSKLPNSNVRLVTVDFDRPTSSAEIMLGNFTEAGGETPYLNDGFSIDGIQVAPVPLPPSVLLLGGALLGLGFVAHRRRRVLA